MNNDDNDEIFTQTSLNDEIDEPQSFMGTDYDYVKQIKTPEELKMSSKGSLETIGRNLSGLVEYTKILVSGDSKASKTGKPLGNKYFLKTGATCTDINTGDSNDRYIYINNIPDGNIPFISAGMGTDFKDFKGLIPGTMNNISKINPLHMLQSFMIGTNPDCKPITMQIIDNNNNKKLETKHVALMDIKNLPPCWFSNNINPETQEKCKESFSSYYHEYVKPNDTITNLYFSIISVFGFYILIKLLEKKN